MKAGRCPFVRFAVKTVLRQGLALVMLRVVAEFSSGRRSLPSVPM